MPRATYASRTEGSTSVASSGASIWTYSQPSALRSAISSQTSAAASSNISNGSEYAAVECSGDQNVCIISGLGSVTLTGALARARA